MSPQNVEGLQSSIRERVITLDTLVQDNHSKKADEARVLWNTYRFSGKLTAVDRCSDSRLSGSLPDFRSLVIPTIATGGAKAPYAELYRDKIVQSVVILAHHDGERFVLGSAPRGCGGEDAKAQNMHGDHGIEKFIGTEVKHADVILQAWRSAADVAEYTKKPVLAASIDHRTLTIYPIAVFLEGGKYILTDVPTKYMFEGQYNPSEIYKKGIPVLAEKDLPDVFIIFLEDCKKRARELKASFSDLFETQQSQNPPALILSTDIRPLSLRYPNTFAYPGMGFEIRVPRKRQGETISISDDLFSSVLDQAEYPLEHFSNLYTVLIETGTIADSRILAKQFLNRKRMRDWKARTPKQQILVAGTNAGKIEDIAVFM